MGRHATMPAIGLVGGDSQALPGDAAKETSGEQAVLAADQDSRGDAGSGPDSLYLVWAQ